MSALAEISLEARKRGLLEDIARAEQDIRCFKSEIWRIDTQLRGIRDQTDADLHSFLNQKEERWLVV